MVPERHVGKNGGHGPCGRHRLRQLAVGAAGHQRLQTLSRCIVSRDVASIDGHVIHLLVGYLGQQCRTATTRSSRDRS